MLLCKAFSFFSSCFWESDICSSGSRRSCKMKSVDRFTSKTKLAQNFGLEPQTVPFRHKSKSNTTGHSSVCATLSVVNWYGMCPWKASWIPDMVCAVFSQNCSRVVWHTRRGGKKHQMNDKVEAVCCKGTFLMDVTQLTNHFTIDTNVLRAQLDHSRLKHSFWLSH